MSNVLPSVSDVLASLQEIDELPAGETVKKIKRQDQLGAAMSSVAQYLLESDLRVPKDNVDYVKQLLELFMRVPRNEDATDDNETTGDCAAAIFKDSVEALGLRPYSIELLCEFGRIGTIEQLVNTTELELRGIATLDNYLLENIDHIVQDIKDALKRLGLSLAPPLPHDNIENHKYTRIDSFFAEDMDSSNVEISRLATRARNCLLINHRVHSVEHLIELPESEVRCIRNLGDKVFNYLTDKLAQYGLSLAPEPEVGAINLSHLVKNDA